MTSKRIVIASVLKTVDDTRMYEKFALSMGKSNKYEVNIIGFFTKNEKKHRNIHFFPVFNFPRISLKRFLAPFTFFKMLLKLKPNLTIITTYELIIPTIIYKWISKTKIFYDIQENYRLNLKTNTGGYFGLKNLWLAYIHCTEWLSKHFFDYFFIAESGYEKELGFFKQNYEVIENKVMAPGFPLNEKKGSTGKSFHFIYSGTASKIYGIFQAVDVYQAVKSKLPEASLTIIGHFPYPGDLQHIKEIVNLDSSINVMGDEKPVPHQKILAAINRADFGIISHQPVESIKNCFPTRIFEYMAFQLPFLLQDHPYWTNYCQPWNCAIPIDFNNYDIDFVVKQIKSETFYPSGVPSQIYWQSEENKLMKVIDLELNT